MSDRPFPEAITRDMVREQASAWPGAREGHLRRMHFFKAPAASVSFETRYGFETIERLQEFILAQLRVKLRATRRGRP